MAWPPDKIFPIGAVSTDCASADPLGKTKHLMWAHILDPDPL
jgi:hypothetical protein